MKGSGGTLCVSTTSAGGEVEGAVEDALATFFFFFELLEEGGKAGAE